MPIVGMSANVAGEISIFSAIGKTRSSDEGGDTLQLLMKWISR